MSDWDYLIISSVQVANRDRWGKLLKTFSYHLYIVDLSTLVGFVLFLPKLFGNCFILN